MTASMKNEIRAHPFSADRPITSRADDDLNRRDFANALAESILSWDGADSLVTGLYGEWGSGKTSLINMIRERLLEADPAPNIVMFNPWEWSGHEELSTAFFEELDAVLKTQQGSVALEVAKQFETYAKALKFGADLTDAVRVTATVGSVAVAAAGGTTLLAGILSTPIVGSIVVAIGILGIIGSQVHLATDKLASLVRRSDEDAKPLERIKDDLKAALEDYDRNILVVVDDLDRLTPSDTVRMLQIVKANADLPKMVYLLAFDPVGVGKSVGAALQIEGKDYVDKIVQVPLSLPKPGEDDLERILTGALDRIINLEPIRKRFDRSRWTTLFLGDFRNPGIKSYFSTPRSVRRFLSAVEFDFSRHIDRGECNVDPVDFIGIEVLRVFDTKAYDAVAAEKAILTRAASGDAREHERAKNALERILAEFPDETRRAAGQHILTELFPAAEWAVTGAQQIHDQERLLAARRLSHPDIFDFYFQMAVPTKTLSEGEIQSIIRSASDGRDVLVESLRDLIQRSLIRPFLTHLSSASDQVPAGMEGIIATALFDIGDELEGQVERSLDVSDTLRSEFIIEDLLKRLPVAKRVQTLDASIQITEGLALPCSFIRFQLSDSSRREAAVLDDDALRRLGTTMAERISRRAEDGTLADSRHLVELMVSWKEFGPSDAAARWADQQAQSPEGFLRLLRAFKGYGSFDGPHPLAEFIDLDVAIGRARDWFESGDLEESTAAALQHELDTFLALLRDHYGYKG